MVVGRGGAAGGVAPGSQRFPQEGSLQLSRVGASARQGRRSFLFTPIPKGGLLIKPMGSCQKWTNQEDKFACLGIHLEGGFQQSL